MAFSKLLADAGHPPTSVETTAKVHLEKTDAGTTVTRIDLDTVGEVPGIDEAEFLKLAESAKANCPISRLLAPGAQITVSPARLRLARFVSTVRLGRSTRSAGRRGRAARRRRAGRWRVGRAPRGNGAACRWR